MDEPGRGLGCIRLCQDGSSWSSAGREPSACPACTGAVGSPGLLVPVQGRPPLQSALSPRLCQLGADGDAVCFEEGEKTRLLGSVITALYFLQMLLVWKLLFCGRNIYGATELGNGQGFVFLNFPLVQA